MTLEPSWHGPADAALPRHPRRQLLQSGAIGARFAAGANNFDVLRLLGALLVLVSHAFALAGHPEAEPFAPLLCRITDGGGLAVAMFFVLSGFLIARAATGSTGGDFLRARALRIYPALAAVVVVQTLLIGPALTDLRLADYLRDPQTVLALLRGLAFSPPLGLPGVFARNPVSDAVNGSLWTLRIEVLCYVLVFVLALTGTLRPGRIWILAAAAFALAVWVALARAGTLPPVVSTPRLTAILDCLVDFAAGALLWTLRDGVPYRAWLATALVAALVAAAGTAAAPLLFHLALPYLVLFLALLPPLPRLPADLSYGIYLYAFPIEQAAVQLCHGAIGPYALVAVSMPPTLICAALSQRFIERPALRLRRRPLRRAPPC